LARLSDEEAALLKAVCRAPADDLPRLVYADWLEEHDRAERAEFIRLQVEETSDTQNAKAGWLRQQRNDRILKLLGNYRETWLKALPKWATTRNDQRLWLPFRRGFASEFLLVASPFIHNGPKLLDRTPVSEIRFEQVENVVSELVSCVWLREVPNLDFQGNDLTDGHLATFVNAEWLVGTQHLVLSGNPFGEVGVRALARCRWLSSLRFLDLSQTAITLAGVRFLADSPFLGKAKIKLANCHRLEHQQRAVMDLLGARVLFR